MCHANRRSFNSQRNGNGIKTIFNVFELSDNFWPNELPIFRDDFEFKSSYLFATPHGPLSMCPMNVVHDRHDRMLRNAYPHENVDIWHQTRFTLSCPFPIGTDSAFRQCRFEQCFSWRECDAFFFVLSNMFPSATPLFMHAAYKHMPCTCSMCNWLIAFFFLKYLIVIYIYMQVFHVNTHIMQ